MHAQKGTVSVKERNLFSLQQDPSDCAPVESPWFRMRVVSIASGPTHRGRPHENTTGHDHTEFGPVNYRR